MVAGDEQILPNDHSIKIDFKPNARVLDLRGEWAMSLAKVVGVEEWAIVENTFQLFDKSQTKRFLVAFNQCGLSCSDVKTVDLFMEQVQRFLDFLFNQPAFGTKLFVGRIGLLSRFSTPYNGTFEHLLHRYTERYLDIKTGVYESVGSKDVVDVNPILYMKDDLGQFNTSTGPMKRDQLKRQFFQTRDLDSLPLVSLHYNVDYFSHPEAEMDEGAILGIIRDRARRSWDRHTKVRNLLVGD